MAGSSEVFTSSEHTKFLFNDHPPHLLSVTTIFTYFSCELVIGGLILLNVACKHTMSCTSRLVKS